MTHLQAGILILILGIIASAIGALPSRIVRAETRALQDLRNAHALRVAELLLANSAQVERRRALSSAAWRLRNAQRIFLEDPGNRNLGAAVADRIHELDTLLNGDFFNDRP